MELPLAVDDMSEQSMITIVRPYSEIKNIPSGVIKKTHINLVLKAKNMHQLRKIFMLYCSQIRVMKYIYMTIHRVKK